MNRQDISQFSDLVREAIAPHAYDLISQHLPGPIKTSNQHWRSHCPFHTSDRPSYAFSFNAAGQYQCFACGAFGGSAVKFLMDVSGRSHLETLLDLAEQFNIEPPDRNTEAWQAELARRDRQRTLRKIVAIAATFYRFELDRHPAARQYLGDRQIKPATIDQFRIGYAPPRGNPLLTKLTSQGFSAEDLIDAGVCRRNDQGDLFDFMRDRLIIPICDDRGNPIALAGRTLTDAEPKYLNTPDTEIFAKNKITYGLDHAAPLWKKGTPLVLVEGYFDAIALLSQGIAAGAVMGTGLTHDRAFSLSRKGAIAIGFDNDSAGQKATWRIIDNERVRRAILSNTIAATVIDWQPAKDPDQLQRDRGLPAVQDAIANAQPYLQWAIHNTAIAYPQAAPAEREPLRRQIAELINDIPSPVERLERQREIAMHLAPGDPDLQLQITQEARTVRRQLRETRSPQPVAPTYRPGETAELAIARCLLHRDPNDWDILETAADIIESWQPYWPELWDLIWSDMVTAPQLELHPDCPDFPPFALRSLINPNEADRLTLSDPITTIRAAARALQTELDERHRLNQLAWLLEDSDAHAH